MSTRVIFRAMCREERDKTVLNKKPTFDTKRFKWFSDNVEWIKSRVQDGKFNNSNLKKERYVYLLKFKWDGKRSDFESYNEIQFDRRRNPTIKYIGEVINE